MKRFLILFLALISLTSHAQFNDPQKALGIPNNALSNPGFEGGLAGWVKSGGNWSLSGVINAGQGKNALAMEFTAADQTLKTELTAIPRAIVAKFGGACMASFVYLGGGGNTYQYYVEDSSSNVVGGYTASQTMFQITSNATDYTGVKTMTFVCDEDETYRLVIKNKTASTQTLYVDNAVLGGNDGLGASNQIGSWQSYTPSLSTGLGTLSGVNLRWRKFGDSMQIQGEFTTGTVTASTAELGLPTGYTIGGPTSARVQVGNATRGGAAGPSTIMAVQGRAYLTFGAGATSRGDVAGSSLFSSSETVNISVWLVPITQFSADTISRSDAPGIQWTAFTPTGNWVANTTYTGFYQCIAAGSLSVQYKLAITGAPTATALNLNLPAGFTIDTSRIVSTGTANVLQANVSLYDASPTTLIAGLATFLGSTSIGISYLLETGSAVNFANVTQAAPFTWASGDQIVVNISNIPVTDSSPCNKAAQPIIPGAVYSSSAGTLRIETLTFGGAASGGAPTSVCSASPCAVAAQTGGVSSVTRAGVGTYSVNFISGTFSSTPRCTFSTGWPSIVSAGQAGVSGLITKDVVSLLSYSVVGTAVDSVVHVICVGDH